MKRNNIGPGQSDILGPPAYPFGGPQLFRRLRFMMAEAFGAEQTFRWLGKLTGQPPSTTQNWFQSFEHPHLIFFLCLLEQLPEKKRFELISEFCRELPLLNQPRLAHDPLAVGALGRLVGESKGVTIIRGGTDFQRTYVLTALGHAFERSKGGEIAGMDLHDPVTFVPVQGLVYLNQALAPAKLQEVLNRVWPAIRDSQVGLLLLNGVWSAVPHLRRQIIEEAATRHVILADTNPPAPVELRRSVYDRATMVTVSHAKENPSWIRVQLSAV
jgi:hypothetical protein